MPPQLKFQLNKSLDKKIGQEFLEYRHAGSDFGTGIKEIHPTIEKENIKQYVDDFYESHKEKLKKTLVKFEKAWQQKCDEFFSYINKIFKNYPWPKGKYIAYLSIFPCNPRFLKDKTFQIFYQYNPRQIQHVICHELLHFMFYDYVAKNFKKQAKKVSQEQLWTLSEIFNNIIFQRKQAGYPGHQGSFGKYKDLWRKNEDIDSFLKKSLSEIKKDFSE